MPKMCYQICRQFSANMALFAADYVKKDINISKMPKKYLKNILKC